MIERLRAGEGPRLRAMRGAPHDGDGEATYLISMRVAPDGRGRGSRRLVRDVAAQNAWAPPRDDA